MTRWAQREHCATLRAMRFTPSGALSAQAIEHDQCWLVLAKQREPLETAGTADLASGVEQLGSSPSRRRRDALGEHCVALRQYVS